MASCLHLLTCGCLKPRRRKSQGQASSSSSTHDQVVDRSISVSEFDTPRVLITGEGMQRPTVYSAPIYHQQGDLNAIPIGTARSDSYYNERKDEFEAIHDHLHHVSSSNVHRQTQSQTQLPIPTSIYSTLSTTAAHDYNTGHVLPRRDRYESRPEKLESGTASEARVPFTASSTSDSLRATNYTLSHAHGSASASSPAGNIPSSTTVPASNYHMHSLIPSSQSITLASSSNENPTIPQANDISHTTTTLTSPTVRFLATPDLGKPLDARFDQLPITPTSENGHEQSQVSGPYTHIESSSNTDNNDSGQWPSGTRSVWPYTNNPAPASVKRWYDNSAHTWDLEDGHVAHGGISNPSSNIPASTLTQTEGGVLTPLPIGEDDNVGTTQSKNEGIRGTGNPKRESAKTEEDRLGEFVFM